MDESKLYPKVMGIEEARKEKVPMSPSVKIPKCLRLSTSGGRCSNCGRETMEGHEDGHGVWHYRCPHCVSRQNPKDPNPCPRCGCTAHETICDIIPVDSHFSERLKNTRIINPFKPDVTIFRCLNCSFEWTAPEYEKYLLVKAIISVLPTSEFSEKK